MESFTLFLRQVISLAPARYAHVVFAGMMLGAGMNAVQSWLALLHPAESWAVVTLGAALLVVPYVIIDLSRRTKRIKGDLELLEVVMDRGNFGPAERKQVYRKVAEKLAEAIGEDAIRAAEEKMTDEPQRELPK